MDTLRSSNTPFLGQQHSTKPMMKVGSFSRDPPPSLIVGIHGRVLKCGIVEHNVTYERICQM